MDSPFASMLSDIFMIGRFTFEMMGGNGIHVTVRL